MKKSFRVESFGHLLPFGVSPKQESNKSEISENGFTELLESAHDERASWTPFQMNHFVRTLITVNPFCEGYRDRICLVLFKIFTRLGESISCQCLMMLKDIVKHEATKKSWNLGFISAYRTYSEGLVGPNREFALAALLNIANFFHYEYYEGKIFERTNYTYVLSFLLKEGTETKQYEFITNFIISLLNQRYIPSYAADKGNLNLFLTAPISLSLKIRLLQQFPCEISDELCLTLLQEVVKTKEIISLDYLGLTSSLINKSSGYPFMEKHQNEIEDCISRVACDIKNQKTHDYYSIEDWEFTFKFLINFSWSMPSIKERVLFILLDSLYKISTHLFKDNYLLKLLPLLENCSGISWIRFINICIDRQAISNPKNSNEFLTWNKFEHFIRSHSEFSGKIFILCVRYALTSSTRVIATRNIRNFAEKILQNSDYSANLDLLFLSYETNELTFREIFQKDLVDGFSEDHICALRNTNVTLSMLVECAKEIWSRTTFKHNVDIAENLLNNLKVRVIFLKTDLESTLGIFCNEIPNSIQVLVAVKKLVKEILSQPFEINDALNSHSTITERSTLNKNQILEKYRGRLYKIQQFLLSSFEKEEQIALEKILYKNWKRAFTQLKAPLHRGKKISSPHEFLRDPKRLQRIAFEKDLEDCKNCLEDYKYF